MIDCNSIMDDEQQMRARMKPNPSIDDMIGFVSQHWTECGTIRRESMQRIESYDDANFYCEAVDTRDGHDQQYRSYLIKCYNAVETCNEGSSNLLRGLGLMLSRINEKITTDLQVPTIVMPHNSNDLSSNYMLMDECLLSDDSRQQVAVRLFKWIQGYEALFDCLSLMDGWLLTYNLLYLRY